MGFSFDFKALPRFLVRRSELLRFAKCWRGAFLAMSEAAQSDRCVAREAPVSKQKNLRITTKRHDIEATIQNPNNKNGNGVSFTRMLETVRLLLNLVAEHYHSDSTMAAIMFCKRMNNN